MRDAVVFYSQFDDPVAWQKALQAELPDLGFQLHPDVGDLQAVRYALTWKPPAGFFAPFPNLVLVVNLGAGVDSLVARDDLPDVPISRLQDDGMGGVVIGGQYGTHVVVGGARLPRLGVGYGIGHVLLQFHPSRQRTYVENAVVARVNQPKDIAVVHSTPTSSRVAIETGVVSIRMA